MSRKVNSKKQISEPVLKSSSCECSKKSHGCKYVVLTGGPGAGKTAVLEMVRRTLCSHVVVLPEAASIIFNGGFPRRESLPAKKGAQRAIYHVQREQERIFGEEKLAAIALCDRGTLDGLAYWPASEASFFEELGTSRQVEMQRYSAIIHLRTPSAELGYNHKNPVRTEKPLDAAKIDEKIATIWKAHPELHFVESTEDFIKKAAKAIDLIAKELPECCKKHLQRSKSNHHTRKKPSPSTVSLHY